MASVGCYVVFIKVSLKYSSRYSEGFEQKNSEDTEGIVCVCVCGGVVLRLSPLQWLDMIGNKLF